jgi:hypothetical protein
LATFKVSNKTRRFFVYRNNYFVIFGKNKEGHTVGIINKWACELLKEVSIFSIIGTLRNYLFWG